MLANNVTGREQRIEGFSEAHETFDAYVTTAEYDPRNSKNGSPAMEEAKAFAESFKPGQLYGAEGISVEPEVRPTVESSGPASAAAPALSHESAVAEPQPKSAVSFPEHEPHFVAAPNSR